LSLEERRLRRVSKDGLRVRVLRPSFETLASQAPQDEVRILRDSDAATPDAVLEPFKTCRRSGTHRLCDAPRWGSI